MRANTWSVIAAGCAAMLLAGALTPARGEGDTDERAFSELQRRTQVELGRRLFFDPTVSRTGTVSCADCHDPEHGFSDPRKVSIDETGPLPRHSQSVLDLTEGGFHWDGEFRDLAALLHARLATLEEATRRRRSAAIERLVAARRTSGDEGATVSTDMMRAVMLSTGKYGRPAPGVTLPVVSAAHRLQGDARYGGIFARAFGEDAITTERLSRAIDAYLRTLVSGPTAFDRHNDGHRDALTPAARRGLDLFRGSAGCAECHSLERKGPGKATFRNTGVESRRIARGQERPVDASNDRVEPDAGHMLVSIDTKHTQAFKAPALWNVAARAPYMHDGSLGTLEDVVRYYDRGGTPNPNLDARLQKLHLEDRDVADLVAFLESLSSDVRPGLGEAPDYRPARQRVRIVDPKGEPIAGLNVRVLPFGDRLHGTDRMPDAFEERTDSDGWLAYRFPGSTQVRLEADGLRIGDGAPIPDWVERLTQVATPDDVVTFRVRWIGESPPPDAISAERPHGAELQFVREARLENGDLLFVAPAPGARSPERIGLSAKVASAAETAFHLGDLTLDLTGAPTPRLFLPQPREARRRSFRRFRKRR